MTTLFHVTTTVPEFQRHRNVQLLWFVEKRLIPEERPYSELIENYNNPIVHEGFTLAQERRDPEGAIDELFSEEEAEAFVAWLKQNYKGRFEQTAITECELPLPFNMIGLGATPFGGGVDCLILDGLERYSGANGTKQ